MLFLQNDGTPQTLKIVGNICVYLYMIYFCAWLLLNALVSLAWDFSFGVAAAVFVVVSTKKKRFFLGGGVETDVS